MFANCTQSSIPHATTMRQTREASLYAGAQKGAV